MKTNLSLSLLLLFTLFLLGSCGNSLKDKQAHTHISSSDGKEGTCSMHPSVRLPWPGSCPICGMDLIPVRDERSDKQLPSSDGKEGTCSMHPSVRLPLPGSCPICGMDLIPVRDERSNEQRNTGVLRTDALDRFAQIETFKVDSVQSIPALVIDVSGYIAIDETTRANVVTHMPGRLEKLFINEEGEYVKSGSIIAMLYSSELITAQKELLEANKLIDITPSLLQAAINKLSYWRIDSATIGHILTTGAIIDPFPLYAERSGTVNDIYVAVGDHLEAGSVLFSIYDPKPLWAIMNVYETDLPHIRVGDMVSISTSSYPVSVSGKVDFIYPSLSKVDRLARIRVQIANPPRQFLISMLVEGRVYSSQPVSGVLVPKSAVLWTGKQSAVYRKQYGKDSSVFYTYKPISLGKTYGKYYEVLSGLRKGDEVVQQGAFILDAEVQVQHGEGMMGGAMTKYSFRR